MKSYLSCMLCAVLLLPTVAMAQDAPVPVPPVLTGPLDIKYHSKFLNENRGSAFGGLPTGYASVRYSVGLPEERKYIERVLKYVSQVFPAKFGNSNGTYTVTLTVADLNGKLLAKAPIMAFQWTKESGFIFFERTVNQLRQTTWKGTLVDEMLIAPDNQRLKISVEIYFQEGRSLDFQFLNKTAKTFTAGALASYFPLPAAADSLIEAVSSLVDDIYANSKKDDLVDADEVAMIATETPIKSNITIDSSQGRYQIPVYITVETKESKLINGNLDNGRFKNDQISVAIFNATGIQIGDGKAVSIVELISTASDPTLKNARPLLDAVLSGGTYGKDPNNKKEEDIGTRCSILYDALNKYMSKYDARAMFYAFLKNYGDRINKEACLGARQSELAAVGLQP